MSGVWNTVPINVLTFLLIFIQLCWISSIKLNSMDGRVNLNLSLFSGDSIIFPIIWGYCFAGILMSSSPAGVITASSCLQPPNKQFWINMEAKLNFLTHLLWFWIFIRFMPLWMIWRSHLSISSDPGTDDVIKPSPLLLFIYFSIISDHVCCIFFIWIQGIIRKESWTEDACCFLSLTVAMGEKRWPARPVQCQLPRVFSSTRGMCASPDVWWLLVCLTWCLRRCSETVTLRHCIYFYYLTFIKCQPYGLLNTKKSIVLSGWGI